ncbi:hypothetical protein FOZ61_007553 [Perkinsus olseni]|uniref:Major facilitator superfamily (MFS) profile domain-containing protein n=1 Tax=Perkinsus olseni TaxID=32597 RepID=A0A7J6L8J0_PEROL|nr:hypothetical protein FOZ61_007553 [Perkinsus olseni]
MVCIFTDFLGDNLLAPSYELFIREHGIPGMGFGLAVSIITVSYIVGRCIAAAAMGSVSDYTGRWNTIMVCSLPTAIGFLMQALSWSFWSLVGFRFFTGFIGGTRVVIIVYITDWMTERNMLTFWMSFIPIVSSVSSFAGPFLGGIVAQADTSEPLNPAYAGLALNAASFLLESRLPLVSTLWPIQCRNPGVVCPPCDDPEGAGPVKSITGQLLVLPFLFHRLKFSEGAVLVFGFALAPFIIILGFVTDVWATVAIGSLFALVVPLTMTMGFATFSRLCDPSKKSLIMGLLALSLNSFKIVSVLLAGVLYDVDKSPPYIMLFCVVTVGILAGIAMMRIMPMAARRRSHVKVVLAATEASRSRINVEKRVRIEASARCESINLTAYASEDLVSFIEMCISTSNSVLVVNLILRYTNFCSAMAQSSPELR